MTLGELIFVAALFAVPAWLLIRGWGRYLALPAISRPESLRMQAGLAFISLTTIMWFAALALMMLEDRNAAAKSFAVNVPAGAVELLNLILCIAGLICSAIGSKSQPQSARLRKAIALSSGFLMLPWLFLAANPH